MLPPQMQHAIAAFAQRYGVKRVTLFGSRARGTNRERSDIDLAAFGGDVDGFRDALNDEADTLLAFDVVDAGAAASAELQAAIQTDGVVLYEEV